mmetsp:Transcript_8716/g.35528  ORF Transcript_8716/g.35528 Transcript_8716/m.35528 type:complete len:243 (-) Transcript_8716:7461-8189(-)
MAPRSIIISCTLSSSSKAVAAPDPAAATLASTRNMSTAAAMRCARAPVSSSARRLARRRAHARNTRKHAARAPRAPSDAPPALARRTRTRVASPPHAAITDVQAKATSGSSPSSSSSSRESTIGSVASPSKPCKRYVMKSGEFVPADPERVTFVPLATISAARPGWALSKACRMPRAPPPKSVLTSPASASSMPRESAAWRRQICSYTWATGRSSAMIRPATSSSMDKSSSKRPSMSKERQM